MKKLIELIILLTLVCLFLFIASTSQASEIDYETNVQTSFYGEYSNSIEDGEGETDSNSAKVKKDIGKKKEKRSLNKDINDYTVTGNSTLPNTGVSDDIVYTQIGALIVIGIIVTGFLLSKRKRRENI